VPDASDTKRPLRVLTLVDRLGTSGGGERLAMEITRRLDPERFERYYCVSRMDESAFGDDLAGRTVAMLRDEGVNVLGLGRSSSAAIWEWRPLVRFLRDRGVDVLHSHKFGSNVWAAVIAPLAGVPVFIAHEHTWSFEGRPVRRLLDRRLIARNSSAFLAVSEDDRRKMIEIEHIDPGAVTVVPNGIDALPAGDGARVRRELGLADDDPVVGAVAVLRPQKGLEILLRAVAELTAEFPRLKLVIAGDGPERPALEALARELGIGDRLHLLGLRSDVPDLLAAFDIAANSSWFEGSPLAMLEYMDAGLPIVATKVGGVPDLIEPGRDGVLVEPGDATGLAAGIAGLLRDRDRARSIGEHARGRRREQFDLATTVRRLEDMYEELAAARGRDGRSP
jgi:glycosyltransferase involved in cell wall biosynthesis